MVVSIGLALAAAVGCDSGPIYNPDSRRNALGSVPDEENWVVFGTVSDPANAIDGSIHTCAVAAEGQQGPTLTIDLGRRVMFNMVVVDHGRNEFGFARQVVIHTSGDGQTYTRQYTGWGSRRVSSFLLLTPVLARFIRLEATVPGSQPWSIAEVHIQ